MGSLGFDGTLLSPDFSVPHRLRDGWRPPEPTQAPESTRVVIVGGGASGLSAAWKLKQSGLDDFVLLELGDRVGGTALSGSLREQAFPWGAHYLPVPMRENKPLIGLLEQMGVVTGSFEDGSPRVGEQFLCREPEERVFSDGVWTRGLYPVMGAGPDEIAQRKRFREQIGRWAERRDPQGRRLFAIPMSQGSDDDVVRQLDQFSMGQWLDREGFTSSRLRWLVNYCCRDDYGLTLDQTSAWAGIFYFASRMRNGQSGSQEVITWPNGNGQIVDFLATAVGDPIRTSHVVVSIKPSDNAGTTRVRVFDSRLERTFDIDADHVIFAAPQFLAPHLIDRWSQSGRDVASFHYGGWVVANVFLRDRPAEDGSEMAWDNVLVDSRSLGYVNAAHQTGRDHGPTVLTWYYPMIDEDPRVSRAELMRLTWSDWASVVITDLGKAHRDIHGLIERLDVMRWGHAMVQPRVGFVWSDARQRSSQSLGRIHFAASDLSGVALFEEAFDRGLRAAEKCLST